MAPPPVIRFYAEFVGSNGRKRFIGEGRSMPFRTEEARLFETRAEAMAAFRDIHPAHVDHRFGCKIRQRKVVIVRSIVETMIRGEVTR